MLTTQQQALIQAIEELELRQVQKLLAEGLDPNFIDPEQGPPVSIICDGIFKWWEDVSEAYEAGTPLSKQEKQDALQVYLDILDALIQAKANVHLWDAENFMATMGCGKSACAPAVQRLLDKKLTQIHVMKKDLPFYLQSASCSLIVILMK